MPRKHIPVPGGRRSAQMLDNLARGHAAQRQRYQGQLETYRELAGQGEHPERIAVRMGVCARTVERYRAAARR